MLMLGFVDRNLQSNMGENIGVDVTLTFHPVICKVTKALALLFILPCTIQYSSIFSHWQIQASTPHTPTPPTMYILLFPFEHSLAKLPELV